MTQPAPRTLTPLARHALLAFTPGPGETLAAERGRLLVTQTGDPDDALLAPGQAMALRTGGRVVVEALDAAVVQRALPPPTGSPWAWLQRQAACWRARAAARRCPRPWHAVRHLAGLE